MKQLISTFTALFFILYSFFFAFLVRVAMEYVVGTEYIFSKPKQINPVRAHLQSWCNVKIKREKNLTE